MTGACGRRVHLWPAGDRAATGERRTISRGGAISVCKYSDSDGGELLSTEQLDHQPPGRSK
jgi:hypothetical protein